MAGSITSSPSPTSSTAAADFVEYGGREGVTALHLLIEATGGDITFTGSGESAFVTAIAGREADPASEFWALYVNGEFAMVGAGVLITRDEDVIRWQIEEF